ncbi:hypothetical protein ES705_11396 [subsurface metagenome]
MKKYEVKAPVTEAISRGTKEAMERFNMITSRANTMAAIGALKMAAIAAADAQPSKVRICL